MTLLLGYKKQMVEAKYDIDQLMILAQQKVEETTTGSTLLARAPRTRIPSLMHTEVHIGRLLGKGGFGVVCEVAKVELDDEAESTDTTVIELSNSSRTYPGYELFMKDYTSTTSKKKQEQPQAIIEGHFLTTSGTNSRKKLKRETVQDRDFIARNYRRRTGRKLKARYALKRVKDSCIDNAEKFVNGVIDLAIEAKFLAVLRHPNIIKMRATAMTDAFSPEDPYFIVLDKLDEILSKRLVQWAKQQKSVIRKLHCQSYKKEQNFWVERIKVAHDVANALKYLHSRHVLYRDIKPENIGFDVRGDVKLFDFGLAKEYHPKHADANGTYQLTAQSGSLRYMAPEVMLGKPYNEGADVYSLSILLWQLLTLKTPYAYYVDEVTFRERMANMGRRPPIDPEWPQEIRNLLQTGWSAEIGIRPSMGFISMALKYEVDQYNLEETIDFEKTFDLHVIDTDFDDDASRKSEISYLRLVKPNVATVSTVHHK